MSLENIVPEDILFGDGQDNMGGLATLHAWAPVSHFDAIGEIKADPTTFAEGGEIETAHTFKAGKGWLKLYSTEDTSGLMDESVGERDGKSFKNKVTVFHPGTKSAVLGLIRYLNNTGVIFLAQESEGAFRQVGSRRFPAKIDSSTVDTATTTDGRKGCTFEISAANHLPSPVYPFTVEYLSEASNP